MRLIDYDDTISRPLPFYLAMEEYFARNFTDDSFFFMWQVDPTVIIGRHQLLESEIDMEFCRRNGIDIVRRKSGGGAVYADRNNIMFSHITASGHVADTFREYTRKVADMLRRLGVDASASDRNDVLAGERKISGNAFYHLAGRSIVHGTMLYDADREMMAGALTPSITKLKSKGVASVRSRITTLREHRPDVALDDFKKFAATFMTDGEPYRLTDTDIDAISIMAKEYGRPERLAGCNPAGTFSKTVRYPGVGEITVSLAAARGKITSVTLTGDFFASQDMPATISSLLEGIEYRRDAVEHALEGTDISALVTNLTKKQFIDLIF
ncbi:MAG: lipoyltransferase [Duncaniella sp.]|nr:lipoyltransferase [Duncaniella sp.]